MPVSSDGPWQGVVCGGVFHIAAVGEADDFLLAAIERMAPRTAPDLLHWKGLGLDSRSKAR